MQVNVRDAKSRLSRLLELVEQGEQVTITRNGKPVAELIPARKTAGFPFDIASQKPLVPAGDQWWQPVSDTESEDWIEGSPIRTRLAWALSHGTSAPLISA